MGGAALRLRGPSAIVPADGAAGSDTRCGSAIFCGWSVVDANRGVSECTVEIADWRNQRLPFVSETFPAWVIEVRGDTGQGKVADLPPGVGDHTPITVG